MATGTSELTVTGPSTPKTYPARKSSTGRRRRTTRSGDPASARFFLIKGSSNGSIELGQEVASENDAIVESFRGGGSFAVVTEWKPVADVSSGSPVIKKEAIVSEKKISHS